MSKIRFIEGDISDALERKEIVVHCVSSDFEMGIGVAKTLATLEPTLRPMMRKAHPMGKEGEFSPFTAVWESEDDKTIFNLVTKYRYFNKPTLDTLRLAIMNMASILERYMPIGDIHISMPMIASGADKIHWCKTEKLLKELLSDRVNITVYTYNPRRKRKRIGI